MVILGTITLSKREHAHTCRDSYGLQETYPEAETLSKIVQKDGIRVAFIIVYRDIIFGAILLHTRPSHT